MTHEEAERMILGVIEAQFDIHAMDPEDFAELWVGIGAVLRRFAGTDAAQVDRSRNGQDAEERLDAEHESAVGSADAPKHCPNDGREGMILTTVEDVRAWVNDRIEHLPPEYDRSKYADGKYEVLSSLLHELAGDSADSHVPKGG